MKKHRKFRSVVQKEEKKSNLSLYWSIFISVIMVGAVGGIILSNPNTESSYVYGKYSFSTKDNLWVTKISGKETSFYFLPDQVSYVNISSQAITAVKDRTSLVVLFNPDLNDSLKLQAIDLFRFELVETLTKTYPQKQLGFAVTKNSTQYPYQIISCANASFYTPILFVDYGNETSVEYSNNCIKVSALDERSVLIVLDDLRYHIYGVFDD